MLLAGCGVSGAPAPVAPTGPATAGPDDSAAAELSPGVVFKQLPEYSSITLYDGFDYLLEVNRDVKFYFLDDPLAGAPWNMEIEPGTSLIVNRAEAIGHFTRKGAKVETTVRGTPRQRRAAV